MLSSRAVRATTAALLLVVAAVVVVVPTTSLWSAAGGLPSAEAADSGPETVVPARAQRTDPAVEASVAVPHKGVDWAWWPAGALAAALLARLLTAGVTLCERRVGRPVGDASGAPWGLRAPPRLPLRPVG